jgi:cytochrome P450
VPEGPGYRAVTRHAHIVEVSRHPEIYQSGKGATSIPDMPEELLEYFGSMVNTDNPRHAQLRRIVSAAFSPRMIKSIEDRIEFVANEVIDRIAAEGGCDFVVDVAAQLPLEIICGMMGIGPADYGTVCAPPTSSPSRAMRSPAQGTRSISPPMPIPWWR